MADIVQTHWVPVYGGILWNYNGGGQSTAADTYTKMLNATADFSVSQGVTPQYASSQLTVQDTGVYMVYCNMSFSCTINNTIFHCAIFLDDVEQQIEIERKISTAGDVGACSMNGIIQAPADGVIDVRFKPDKLCTTTLAHCQLWVKHV